MGSPTPLSRAAMLQSVCGAPALPDGTRVLELTAAFYYQRFRQFSGGPGLIIQDTSYQYFDGRAQFVLRSVQYDAEGEPLQLQVIFSDGRVLTLPPILSAGAGLTNRLDCTGTASDNSAGGIPISACDRVAVVGQAVELEEGQYEVSIKVLFIGVLRFFFPPDPSSSFPSYPVPRDAARAILSSNQNLFAPEVMRGFQCYPETPPGYRDELFTAVSDPLTITLANGVSPTASGAVALPNDAPFFVWRGYDAAVLSQAGGVVSSPPLISVRFRTMNGEVMSDELVDVGSTQGPIFPELSLPGGSRLFYDAAISNGDGTGAVVVQFVFTGVRRYRV